MGDGDCTASCAQLRPLEAFRPGQPLGFRCRERERGLVTPTLELGLRSLPRLEPAPLAIALRGLLRSRCASGASFGEPRSHGSLLSLILPLTVQASGV
jgi:hypothetical protein